MQGMFNFSSCLTDTTALRQMIYRFLIFVFLFVFTENALAKQPIKFFGQVDNAHVGQLFFVDFLNLLWQEPELADNYQLIEIAEDAYRTQRLHALLMRKVIDINWAGAEQKFNQEATKIPFPVVAGLLGYRVAILREEDMQRFSSLHTLEDLRTFKACQGETWFDADILEFNEIPVLRVSNNASMVKMLIQGRCDMFPRAIQEAAVELAEYQKTYPALTLNKSVLFQYDFASYLYVRRTDSLLAERLNMAFSNMISNGRYQKLLEEHEYTKHIFPLSQWENAHFINLQSPDEDPDRRKSPNYLDLVDN